MNEVTWRLSSFGAVFLGMAAWERIRPRRALREARKTRWVSNLGLAVLSAATIRGLLPLLPTVAAELADRKGWGLFHAVRIAAPWDVVLSMVALDLVVYLQHVLTHALPTLWRLHMVHHTDLDIDCTTGVRFHPMEIFLSGGLKTAAVFLLGAPVAAVLLFEILLNATALFSHANLHIPGSLDRTLRLFVVTPDMHRVHHSVIIRETHSNFGFCLPWWDRLFGTYQAQPRKGHLGMEIGLAQYRDAGSLGLLRLLVLPVLGDPGRQPINRH